jgi:ribulose-bisphosphate carboxylase small chain
MLISAPAPRRPDHDKVHYALDRACALDLEYKECPHPQNSCWSTWGVPIFGPCDAAGVMIEMRGCRDTQGDKYIRIVAFDSTKAKDSIRMSFTVNCQTFQLVRSEELGRSSQ